MRGGGGDVFFLLLFLFFLHLCQAPCIHVGGQDIRFAVGELNMCRRKIKQKHQVLDHMIRITLVQVKKKTLLFFILCSCASTDVIKILNERGTGRKKAG